MTRQYEGYAVVVDDRHSGMMPATAPRPVARSFREAYGEFFSSDREAAIAAIRLRHRRRLAAMTDEEIVELNSWDPPEYLVRASIGPEGELLTESCILLAEDIYDHHAMACPAGEFSPAFAA